MATLARQAFSRSRVQRFLTVPCVIWRDTSTPDDAGGRSDTWRVVLPGTRCALFRRRGLDVDVAGRLMLAEVTVIWLPLGTAVLDSDRITVGPDTYTIVSRDVDGGITSLLLSLQCARIGIKGGT